MTDNDLYELHNQIRRLRAMVWTTGIVAVVVAAGLSVLVWSVINEQLRRQQPHESVQVIQEQLRQAREQIALAMQDNRPDEERIGLIREEIEQVRNQMDQMAKDFKPQFNIIKAASEIMAEMNLRYPLAARLRSDSKSYGVLSTTLGPLLVSWDKIEPYMDGYKMTLLVGNPTTATINDGELVLAYKGNAKTHQIVNPIYPGRWNPVEVIVTPAKPEDLSVFAVSINPSAITFK